MRRNLAMRVQYYLASKQQERRRAMILRCLAVIVAFTTAYALIMPAITQSNALLCGMDAHTHTEDCWTTELAAPQPELICTAGQSGEIVAHTHDSDCYNQSGRLVCPLSEQELHVHTSKCYREHRELICEEIQTLGHAHSASCYTYVRGELTCALEEEEGHVHTSACYAMERDDIPDCGQEEGGHTHTGACYTTRRGDTPSCGQEEGGHTHTGACYTTERSMTCGQRETEGHSHSDECYREKEVKTLTCDLSVGEGEETDEEGNVIRAGHSHSGSCYTTETEQVLSCGQKESRGHTHSDACYSEKETLTCTLEEGHSHSSACYPTTKVLTCTLEEGQGHVHTDECYPEKKTLICQEKNQGHAHSDSCYDWSRELRCQEEERESGHIHTDECYEITELLSCRKEELILHTHSEEECYYYDEETEELELICDKLEVISHQHSARCFFTPEGEPTEVEVLSCGKEEHVHTEECYVEIIPKEEDIYFCGYLEHIHTEDCYFESGALRCTLTEHVHSLACMEEEPEEPQIPEELVTGVELDEYFDYESDAFRATFHITGYAEVYGASNGGASGDDGGAAPGRPDDTDGAEPGEPDEGDTGGAGEDDSGDVSQQPDSDANPEKPTANGAAGAESGEVQTPPEEPSVGDEIEIPLAEGVPDLTEPPESMDLPVADDPPAPVDVTFNVEPLDEDSLEYQRMASHAEEYNGGMELPLLQVLTFSAELNGRELDISGCTVEVEITLSEPLMEYLSSYQEAQPMAIDDGDGAAAGSGFTLMAFTEENNGKISELGAMNTAVKTSMVVPLSEGGSDNNTVTIALLSTLYPQYKVEYYANIMRPATKADPEHPEGGAETLPFIDTSKETGDGRLPVNGNMNLKTKDIWVDENGNMLFKPVPTEIYRAQDGLYYNPREESEGNPLTVNRLDAIANNKTENNDIETGISEHYDVSELWVLQPGGNPEADEDWVKYVNGVDGVVLDNLRFTNIQEAADLDKNLILLQENDIGHTTLRLVYEQNKGHHSNSAAFYDYDITDGPNTTDTLITAGGKGINNYEGSSPKLSFGNANIGVGADLENQKLGSSFINRANANNFGKCSFGIANSAEGGKLKLNVSAPNLFDDTPVDGKTVYVGHNLNFNRQGDTYTLSSVSGTRASGLESFSLKKLKWGTTNDYMWSNNFWPMDIYTNDDPQFGGDPAKKDSEGNPYTQKFFNNGNKIDISDNGHEHNSYFGMKFSVKFNLAAEYVGPLEYYFYGDDDMWVFLDGKLVCDIGGVHTAVGEYVDLWDYVDIVGDRYNRDKTVEHRLDVFYTERGATGSTCWMQYTLPNAASVPVPDKPTQPKQSLRIEKAVVGDTGMNAEYSFTIQLKANEQEVTKDGFLAQRYDAEHKAVGEPFTVSYLSEAQFSLKNGEYILVQDLPENAGYVIKELFGTDEQLHLKDYCYTTFTVTTTDANGKVTEVKGTGDTVENTLNGGSANVVVTNTFDYQLPATGGIGDPWYTWAGALLIAACCLWYKKQNSKGGSAAK